MLTPREYQILELVTCGMANREIATELFVSKRTVDFHIANIYDKLGVANRVQAIRRATELGLLHSE